MPIILFVFFPVFLLIVLAVVPEADKTDCAHGWYLSGGSHAACVSLLLFFITALVWVAVAAFSLNGKYGVLKLMFWIQVIHSIIAFDVGIFHLTKKNGSISLLYFLVGFLSLVAVCLQVICFAMGTARW